MADARYAFLVMGPPGVGKSTFAGSVGDAVGAEHVLALCPKPNEANSWGYTSRGITTKIFHDPKWRPHLDREELPKEIREKAYTASGFLDFARCVYELMDDDVYDAVIVDPFTDLAKLISHELLKKDRAATPRDTDSQSYYGALKAKLSDITKDITALQFAKRPKHVIVTCHLQPAKEEVAVPRSQGGGTRDHADKKARGVLFEGAVLPAFEGGFKYDFAGDFDAVLYSDVVYDPPSKENGYKKGGARYVVQVACDPERHAKVRLGPALAQASLPNDFTTLLAAVSAASRGGGA